MGLLDLFRRRPDRTDTLSAPAERGPVSDGVVLEQSGPVQRSADDGGASTTVQSAPRAWELLRPIVPLSHTPIHRTFDAYPASSLRAQRSADDLFVSSSLGHTVDPNASGTVDGLLRVTAAGAGRDFPAFGSGGDRVLRRRTLGAEELASADEAHPRWPIFAAANRAMTPAASTLSVSSTGASSAETMSAPSLARSNPTESVHRAVDDGVSMSSGDVGDAPGMPVVNGADGIGSVDSVGSESPHSDGFDVVRRTTDLVGAAPLTAPLMSLTRPAVARSLDVVADAARPSLITRVSSDAPAPIALARTVASAVPSMNAPVARVVESSVRPTLATQQPSTTSIARIVDEGSTNAADAGLSGPGNRTLATGPASSVESPAPSAAALRRRSIVEVRAESPNAPRSPEESALSTGASTTQRSYESDTSSPSGAVEVALQRSSESSPGVPTLGRRAGLGSPLSELPGSAATNEPSSDPFGAVYGQDHFDAMLRLANRVDRAVDSESDAAASSGFSTRSGGSSSTSSAGPSVSSAPSSATAAGAFASSSPFPILRVVNDDAPMFSGDDEATVGGVATSFAQTAGANASSVLRSFGPALSSSSNANDPFAVVHRSTDLPLVGARALTVSSDSTSPALSGIAGMAASPGRSAVPLQRTPSSLGASPAPRLGVVAEPPASVDTGSSGGSAGSFDHVIARSVAAVPPLGAPSIGANPASAPVPVLPLLRAVDGVGASPLSSAFGGSQGSAPSALPSVRSVSTAAASGEAGGGDGGGGGAVFRSLETTPSAAAVQRVASVPSQNSPSPMNSSVPTNSPMSSPPGQNVSAESPADPAGGDGPGGGGDAGGGGGGGGGGASTGGGSGAGPSSATAEAELDQLAGKLYERLRFRLRRELLDDRERAGLVLDRVR